MGKFRKKNVMPILCISTPGAQYACSIELSIVNKINESLLRSTCVAKLCENWVVIIKFDLLLMC